MKQLERFLTLVVLMTLNVSLFAAAPLKPGTWQTVTKEAGDPYTLLPVVAVDQAGRVVMAYLRSESLNSGINTMTVYVKRWNGEEWESLGTFINERRHRRAGAPSLVIDHDNRPLISWYEEPLHGGYLVFVKRWNGEEWESLGMLNDSARDSALLPFLAVDRDNTPHVLFRQHLRATGTQQMPVKRLKGNEWETVGDTRAGQATPTGIAIDRRGIITISYHERVGYSVTHLKVKRWNGRQWLQFGGVINDYVIDSWLPASLAVSPGGRPYLAWREFDEALDNYVLRVASYEWSTRQWVDYPLAAGSGAEYVQNNVRLLIQDQARPIIAWQDQTDGSVHVQRWNWYHRDWQDLGGQFITGVNRGFDLAVDAKGSFYLGHGIHPGLYQGGLYLAGFSESMRQR